MFFDLFRCLLRGSALHVYPADLWKRKRFMGVRDLVSRRGKVVQQNTRALVLQFANRVGGHMPVVTQTTNVTYKIVTDFVGFSKIRGN